VDDVVPGHPSSERPDQGTLADTRGAVDEGDRRLVGGGDPLELAEFLGAPHEPGRVLASERLGERP
jgi:hypothetical protein